MKKALWILLSIVGAVALFVIALLAVWLFSADDQSKGLREGASLSAAKDCPLPLPAGATNIYYAYELEWQGGAFICRYDLPAGDLKKQAEADLKKTVVWKVISPTTRATVPKHRFTSHGWFQPAAITDGFESDTSGILWEPKVWIDTTARRIYILNQN